MRKQKPVKKSVKKTVKKATKEVIELNPSKPVVKLFRRTATKQFNFRSTEEQAKAIDEKQKALGYPSRTEFFIEAILGSRVKKYKKPKQ